MGPKERGRGARANSSINYNSGTKRTVVPNIAAAASRILAPKWAESKPNASEASIKSENVNGESNSLKNDKGGSKRGSPRGRGRGRGSKLIASEGVFSQGVGEDAFGSQRNRGLRHVKDEQIIGKLEASLNNDNIDEENGNEKKDKSPKKKRIKLEPSTSENLYEEFWQSDDELDRDELDELCGGSFIADLKKCDQLPFVLPNNEAHQFNKIIKIRKKDQDEEHLPENEDEDFKDIKLNKRIIPIEGSSSTKLENCLKDDKFKLASNTIQKIANDKDSNDNLILFQLPSAPLMRIAEAQKIQKQLDNEQQKGDEKVSEKTTKLTLNRLPSNNQEIQTQQKNSLESFPTGSTKIGKLQFLRSGKAVLNIGGHQMNISESINSECFEALLRVEVAGEQQQQNTKDNNLCGFPYSLNNNVNYSSSSQLSTSSGCGTAHLLGHLPFHFVCSFDIKRALETKDESSSSVSAPPSTQQ